MYCHSSVCSHNATTSNSFRYQVEVRRLTEDVTRLTEELENEKVKNQDLDCKHAREKSALETTVEGLTGRGGKAEAERKALQDPGPTISDTPISVANGPPTSTLGAKEGAAPAPSTASAPESAPTESDPAEQAPVAPPQAELTPPAEAASVEPQLAGAVKGTGAKEAQRGRFTRSWSKFQSTSSGSKTFEDSVEESECDGVLLKKERSKMTGMERWTKKHVIVKATHLEYYSVAPVKSPSFSSSPSSSSAIDGNHIVTPTSKSRKCLNLSIYYLNDDAQGPTQGVPTFSLTSIESPPYTITLACAHLEEYQQWL